jgi:PTH1 family peptidyl-tRNA hydrolase
MALAEDVFLARCLLRDAPAVLELAAMRDFLARAVVPERLPELAMDRTVGLEQVSFATLWAEPHRLNSMRATFEYFRGRRAPLAHHASYWQSMHRLRLSLEDGEGLSPRPPQQPPAVGATAGEALAQHGAWWPPSRVPAGRPAGKALGRHFLPACGLTLADDPPSAEVDAVLRRLSRALSQQMTRLSSEAVHRILARARGERIEQFLQVVQASDLAGLASVLDDELLEFLRDLLSGEPGTGRPPVLEGCSARFPVVAEGEVEAATGLPDASWSRPSVKSGGRDRARALCSPGYACHLSPGGPSEKPMSELRGGPEPDAGPSIRLIVGLGNPGREYAQSRHNVGFWCLNRLARRHGIAFSSRGRLAAVGEGKLADRPVILAKPRTFVNLSGRAVGHLLQRYRLSPQQLLVVCDDLTCRWGASASGEGSHGHKGMRSIIDAIGSQDFPRIRIGIGCPRWRASPGEPERRRLRCRR